MSFGEHDTVEQVGFGADDPIVDDPSIRARAAINGAVKADPERAARAARIARDTGMPVAVVERNEEYIAQRQRAAEIEQQAAQSPALANVLADPQAAKIVADDVENLGVLEKGLGYVVNGARAFASAIPSVNRSAWNWLRAGAEVANLPSVAEFAKRYAQQQQAVEQSWMPQSDNWVERSIYGGLQSAGQIGLTLPLGVAGGGSRAVLGGVGAVEAGRSYGEARDKGVGIVPSLGFAAAQATAEIVTEAIPVGRLLADISARSGFVPMILRQMAAEIPGEQVATLWQDFNDWLMLNPEKALADFARERPGRAAETLVATVVAVGATTGSVAAAQRVADRTVRREQVQANGAALGEAMAAAGASKLNERDRALLARFANDVAGDESIFVDAATLGQAAQAAGVDLSTVAQVVPSLAEQLAAAQQTGADVEISVGDAMAYLQPLAATLVEHARIGSPEAPTIAESYAQQPVERGAEIAAELAGVAVEDANAAARTIEAATLQGQIEQSIAATGRYTGDVVTQYASVMSAMFTATAQRVGVDPQALYAEFAPKIVSSIGDVATLDQPRRGAFDPATRTIALLQSADLSTFLHESGHHYLEVMTAVADRSASVAADVDAIMQSFGVTREQWASMDLEARREHHERFARSFEAYLFEGKAPSAELQGVFARLRSWLLAVYKSLASLDVELSPQIREVFDRMLATDEQIAARSLPTLDLSGLVDPVEQAQYHALAAATQAEAVSDLQAAALRDMGRTRRAHGREMQRIAATLAEARATIEAEVSLEVAQEPVFAARAALGAAPAAQKLSTKSLAELYGGPDSVFDRFDWSSVKHLAAEAGQHPDIVAEQLGFDSGDQLVRALVEAGNPAQHVEALVDQRMLERFGELTTPEGVAQAADAALANDSRSRVLLMAANALRRATGSKPILQGQAREAARTALAGRKLRAIKPHQFRAAEAKSQRLAAEAQSRGRIAQAASHARDALLAHEYHREALRIVEEGEKARTYLRKFTSPGVRENLSRDYLDQIDAVLAKLDLRKATDKEIARWSSLADFVAQQEEAGLAPNIDAELVARAMTQPLRDLTVEQMRGIVDTVKSIEHLARLKQKLLTARDQRSFDVRADEAAESIRANAMRARTVELEPQRGLRAWVGDFLADQRKLSSLFREMDGLKDGGAMHELIVRPANDASTLEAAMTEEATRRFAEIFRPILALPGGTAGNKLHIAEIGASLSRGARMAVALNLGNSVNRQRLMDGRGWGPAQVQAIVRTLTAAELQAVNELHAFVDSYWPQVAAKALELSGVELEKVPAEPFTVRSADGVEVTMRGGYWPLKYDADASGTIDAHEAAQAAKDALSGAYLRASTRNSHEKARLKDVKRPVRLSLDVATEHVAQVVHRLAWQSWLVDTNRLLKDSRIDSAIREHYGPAVARTIKDGLLAIAAGDLPARSKFDRALRKLQSNVSRAVMGLSFTTAAVQLTGLTQSMSRVGVGPMVRAITSNLTDAATLNNSFAEIAAKSDFMRLRGQTFNRELHEIQGRVIAGKSQAAQVVDAALFFMVQRMQLLVDVPTWTAGYQKALAEGRSEVDAIAFADAVVRESQGSGFIADTSKVQRDHPLLMQFASFFNSTYNLVAERTARTTWSDPASVGVWLGHMMLLSVLPATVGGLALDLLKGDEPEDDEEFPARVLRWNLGFTMGLFIGVREFAGSVSGFSYAGPPVGRVVTHAERVATQIAQGEVDEPAVVAAASLLGDVFGLPVTQIVRSYRGTRAWLAGDAPGSSVLFGAPPRD